MLEHFSQAARRVVVVADEQARLLGQETVGTGHLLLGLLVIDDDEFAATLLRAYALEVDVVRVKVVELSSHSQPEAATSRLTDEAKRSVELAVRAALRQGRTVGTDDLLLGVIKVEEGVAVRVLEALAVEVANLKAAIVTTQAMLGTPKHPVALGGRDEEVRLVETVRAGAVARRQLAEGPDAARKEELRRQVADGEEAWKTVLTRYTPLVENIAGRYQLVDVPLGDLVVAGTHGLLGAIQKFDARRVPDFWTYATYWVRQAVWARIAAVT